MSIKIEAKPARSTLPLHLHQQIISDEKGATAVEYALMTSGIGVAVAATVWSLGNTTSAFYASLASLF